MADSCPKCGGWHEVRLAGESINCLQAQVAQLTLERDQARSVAESMQQHYDHASHQHYESIRECIELKAELTGCRDLITRIAEAQRPHCTTVCIEGVWWAKCKSGGVYGPHSTEREALLEVAEMGQSTLCNRVREWVEAYANTLRKRMAADRYRGDHGAYAANETVLADLDALTALLTEASDGK